jgi:N-acylglucosamine 2-epimerase
MTNKKMADHTITGMSASKPIPSKFPLLNHGLKKIEDLNLEQLREKYEKELFDQFIPNMENYIIDHALGGFMCSVDILTRKLISTEKKAWFEGRGVWVYSFLCNNLDKNPRYLEIARKSLNFILEHLPADGRFCCAEFSKEGRPLTDAEGDIYGNLFIAEGLAEYSKATGERHYFDQAKRIILKAAERYDSPDFTYPYKAETRIQGPRILGVWMIFLSVTTQVLRQEKDPQMESIADRCVDAIMNFHMNPEYNLLNEALAHDLSPLPDKVATQFGDIGHGCETMAFVMNYAVLTKNKDLFKESAEAFKRHVTVARDTVYGGFFDELENVNENRWNLRKVRWLQEEILIGALILIEHTGDEWALDCFAETDRYVREKFIYPEYAFPINRGDRKIEQPSLIRAEHYHYPRQLMVSLLAIKRMIKREGRPSGLFG